MPATLFMAGTRGVWIATGLVRTIHVQAIRTFVRPTIALRPFSRRAWRSECWQGIDFPRHTDIDRTAKFKDSRVFVGI